MFGGTLVRADETVVYFPTGSSALSKPSKASLKRLTSAASIHLRGSSDPRGNEEINSRLREERVRSVREYLTALGVPEDRIQADNGQPGDGPPSMWAKLRNVTIQFEGAAKRVAAAEKPEPRGENGKPEPRGENGKPEPRGENGKPEAVAARTPDSNGGKPTEGEKAPTKHLEKVRLIYWRTLNHALWIVAKEKGFFEQEGFDVTLQQTDDDARVIAKNVVNPSGVTATKALEAGQKKFFAGAVCGYGVHEAMAKKEPIVDIGSMIMVPLIFVMKKDIAPQVEKNIESLKGKQIGEVTYGEGEHDFKYTNIIRSELEKRGIVEKRDYNIKEFPNPPALTNELASGKLDIALMFATDAVDFVRKHPGYARMPIVRFFPYLPCCRQVVTREQLKNHRDHYVRMLRATIKAHEFIVYHPKEAGQIIGKWLGIPGDVVRDAIMTSYIQLTPDPMRKGVELYQRTNDRRTGTKTSTAEFIDTSLYRDALFGLAREASEDPDRKGYYDTMISRFRANN